MKTEYYRNNNINIINPKERSGKNKDVIEISSCFFPCYVTSMLIMFSYGYCDCCKFGLMNVVVIHDADSTAVEYVCL